MSVNLNKNNFFGVSEEDINEFTCGICFEIFVNPVFTQCCRQIYCFDCINQWLGEHNTCPNDRQQLSSNGLIQPNRALLNIFNNLKVKCNYNLNGCQEILKVKELANHLLNCDFRPNRKCKTCETIREKDKIHDCLENIKIKNIELKENNKDLVNEISKYFEEKDKLDKEISDLKTENKSLNNEIRKLKEKNSEIEQDKLGSKDKISVSY